MPSNRSGWVIWRMTYFSTQHWNETNAQEDGTIERSTQFPDDVNDWVLSGPHFFVATPSTRRPREGLQSIRLRQIDLTTIPADYLPRTNYVPACPPRRVPPPHAKGTVDERCG